MSKFNNKAGGASGNDGGELVFVKPADLARSGFTGIVAEGELLDTLPNRFNEDKVDYKILLDSSIEFTGEDKDGDAYTQRAEAGDTVIVNGAGNLNYLMDKNVAVGSLVQITYQGKNEIQKGKRAGTMAHTFEIAY